MCYRRLTKYECGHETTLPHYCGKSLNPATGERKWCKTFIKQAGVDYLTADKCVFQMCMLNQVPYGGYWNCCQYAHGGVNSGGCCTGKIRKTMGEGSDSWVVDVNCGHFICTRCTVYDENGQEVETYNPLDQHHPKHPQNPANRVIEEPKSHKRAGKKDKSSQKPDQGTSNQGQSYQAGGNQGGSSNTGGGGGYPATLTGTGYDYLASPTATSGSNSSNWQPNYGSGSGSGSGSGYYQGSSHQR